MRCKTKWRPLRDQENHPIALHSRAARNERCAIQLTPNKLIGRGAYGGMHKSLIDMRYWKSGTDREKDRVGVFGDPTVVVNVTQIHR